MCYSRKQMLAFVLAIAWQFGFASAGHADLIGYWPFDEVVDVDGLVGTPDNSPDGGHTGILTDTAELSDDPVRGSVLNLGEFNNGAGVDLPTFPQDDRTEAGVNEDLGPGFNAIVDTQEVTISFWLNRNGDDATNQWTFLFQDGGNRQLGSHAPWSNGQVYFDVSGCCGPNQRINTSMNGADTDGEWHHLAFVKKKNPDESDLAISAIFQDGSALVSSPGCDLVCWDNGAEEDVDWGSATIDDVVPIDAAAIGSAPGGGNSNNGFIDDFAVWNEALSTDRIVSLANVGGVIPIPEGETLGDFNSDGEIGFGDFLIIAENYNTQNSLEDAFFKGDMDGNLRTNLKDFLSWRLLFEELSAGGEASASAVPEPSSGLLIALAGMGMLTFRRRRM